MTTRPAPVPPPPSHTVNAHLVVDDARAAIAFYVKAFGATERFCFDDPRLGGKVVCAEVVIGDAVVSLADEFEEWKSYGPKKLGGTPVSLSLNVPDVDAVFARALAAGAKTVYPLEDQFYGDRSGRIEDPFGHHWRITTHIEDVPASEMHTRMEQWWKSQGK